MIGHQALELLARILVALVAVMHQAVGSATPPDSHDEGIGDESCRHLGFHRPADDAPREQVDNSGIVGDRSFPRPGGWDDGFGFCRLQAGAQAVGVVALVGQQAGGRRHLVQQRRSRRDIGAVTGAEDESHRPAATICQGMDFGGRTATRAPDGLNLRPPFPPWAERCARTAVLSMLRSSGSSDCAARAAKMRVHSPLWLHLLNRLQIVVEGP